MSFGKVGGHGLQGLEGNQASFEERMTESDSGSDSTWCSIGIPSWVSWIPYTTWSNKSLGSIGGDNSFFSSISATISCVSSSSAIPKAYFHHLQKHLQETETHTLGNGPRVNVTPGPKHPHARQGNVYRLIKFLSYSCLIGHSIYNDIVQVLAIIQHLAAVSNSWYS